MFQVLLVIQSLSIVGMLFESVYIVKNWRKTIHGYLLLYSLAVLVNNAGYLEMMLAKTAEAAIVAKKMSYMGSVWISFSLCLFVTELCDEKKMKRFLMIFGIPAHSLVFFLVLSFDRHKLFYSDFQFIKSGMFPHMKYTNGIFHHLYFGLVYIYMMYFYFILLRTFFREKNARNKIRLKYVMIALGIDGAFFLLHIFGVMGEYDPTMLGYSIAMIFMYVAIFRYDLLETRELAKDFIVDRLSTGIIAVDKAGEIEYFNKPAGMLFPDITKSSAQTIQELEKNVEKNEPFHLQDKIYQPEKNMLYQGQKEVGTVYVLVDETDHFQYMEELAEQRKIADSANRAKSFFLANMSHEIRTPINAVLGMDEMILRESTEPKIRTYAADIQMAGQTLLALINDILDFSKVEEGKMEIIPVEYHFAALISDLIRMVKERAEKKGLAFKVKVDPEIPQELFGDMIRIKQCALNLLTNAVKYTEMGQVMFRVSYEKKDEKSILLKIMVSDSGIGLKKEDIDKLLLPFQRIEEKRNHFIEGTGLGLNITSRLLDLMGSSLSVESVYGMGSDFSFVVEQTVINWEPVGETWKKAEKEGVENVRSKELFQAPEAKILVVDDIEMNLVVTESLLKRTLVQVDTVLSGKEALEKVLHTAYDVVFIDHMMPDMDGIETMRALKRLETMENKKHTTYIVLTANALAGARERYLSVGFSDYLSKPVDGEQLEKMLLKYLPKEKIK